MTRTIFLGLVTLVAASACKSSGGDHLGSTQEAQCSSNQTVLYSKVTPPSAGEDGASGIADAPSVLGSSSSSNPSSVPGAPAPTSSDEPFASTTTSCVPSACPAGQVAVAKLGPGTSSAGGDGSTVGVGVGAPDEPPTTGSPATTGDTPVSSGTTTTTTPPTTTTSPPDADGVTCVAPPPACGDGQAPSYAPAGFWHCMPLCDANDPNLVVISYGGIYGNGGVCAGPPPAQACPTQGQVWTWDFMQEAWSCAPECDNGEYDQHTFAGQTVCVPC